MTKQIIMLVVIASAAVTLLYAVSTLPTGDNGCWYAFDGGHHIARACPH